MEHTNEPLKPAENIPSGPAPEPKAAAAIPTPEPSILNAQPSTMEVHHHAHGAHGKKTWKSYFWEFLMLFLAVFCGFLAEYQLEHKIERDRAKELAKSFYHELLNDSLTAEVKVKNRIKQEAALLYMIRYFKDSNLVQVPKQFVVNFEYGISFLSPSLFEPRTVMLDQLRNSGSLRYFKNEEFQNLTGDLTVAIKNIYHRQDLEGENRFRYINPIVMEHYDYEFDAILNKGGKTIFGSLLDYENSNEVIPFHLNNLEKIDRNEIVGMLHFFRQNVITSTRRVHIEKYREINAKLLKILREEYRLK